MTETQTSTTPVDPRHAIDLQSLANWLGRAVGPLAGPLEISKFKGGQSNPTLRSIIRAMIAAPRSTGITNGHR